MYLNRKWYMLYRTIGSIGLWVAGFFSIMMTLGFVFDVINGETSAFYNIAIVEPYFIFVVLFAVSGVFLNKLERAKLYDSFFAEDPDGVMQSHVLAKATGITKERIVKDLGFFQKLHLFQISMTATQEYTTITLCQPRNAAIRGDAYEEVRCQNCGAVNRVRKGYVHTCAYCLGSLYKEETGHVSE